MSEHAYTDVEPETDAPTVLFDGEAAEVDAETPPAPAKADPVASGKKADKKLKRAEEALVADTRAPRTPPSPEMTKLRNAEDQTLRELIENFGQAGSFRIGVKRRKPEEVRDPATGMLVTTAGHLTTLEEIIDEDWLLNKYGGGVYELTFRRRDARGSFVHAGSRTVTIAGSPNLVELPRSVTVPGAAGPAPAPAESGKFVDKALDMMGKQLERAQDRADAPRGTGASDALLTMMQKQLDQSNARYERLDQQLRDLSNKPPEVKPPEDTAQSRMLDKLIDQDTARLTAARMQHDSEIRMLKESALAEDKRLRDVAERDKQMMQIAHERELTSLRMSFDSTMTAHKSSYDTQLQAAKSSYDTQMRMSDAENRKLTGDIAELRAEVKELRAKKDKSILEQAKELEAIKDAIGGDSEEKSTADKVMDMVTNPDVFGAVAGMFSRNKPAEAAPQQAAPKQPQILMAPGGKRFTVGPDGQLYPLKRIKAAPPPGGQGVAPAAASGEETGEEAPPAPAPVPIPTVDPADLQKVIAFFESAYTGGQAPDVVAQRIRPYLTEEILTFTRDHGVDALLSKVARLPGSSPLAVQDGRNWIREVGKLLVG